MKPFVKRAGGKRQILSRIKAFINDSIQDKEDYTYIEPFVGGGAVFFDLAPKKAIISDLNDDLINAYKVIQSDKVENLIKELENHAQKYKEDSEGYYYDVRYRDREKGWPQTHTDVERAARMIFLNRTCYNGLYRVNSKGQFNTPIGRYKNPLICDKENLLEIHKYLSENKKTIQILSNSYEVTLKKAGFEDVIYLDPPYDYEDDDGFTKYQMAGFTFENFCELKKACDEVLRKGSFVIISNNATERVINLFEQDPYYKIFYDVNKFKTLRMINCIGAERKTGSEAIIWGMNGNVPFPQANGIEKIIKLLMCSEDTLNDKEKLKVLLNVNTERQVSYYICALLFLKYLTQNKKFTEDALRIKNNEKEIKKDIYYKLKNNDIFIKQYEYYKLNHKMELEAFKKSLSIYQCKKLSDKTIDRRSSTIKTWIIWMLDYEKDNNIEE